MRDNLLRDKLNKRAKVNKEKNRGIKMRMWLSWLIAKFHNDRGTIPPNIGNNILITENMYITRNSLSVIIATREYTEDTLVGFISELVNHVKSRVSDVRIDVTIKSKPYWINTQSQSMSNRRATWEKQLSDKDTTERQARRAARQLHTLDLAKSGEPLFRSRIYVTVRAENGTILNRGIEATTGYLGKYAMHKVIRSNVQNHLEYLSLMCNKISRSVKDIQPVLTSLQTIAEMFPQTQSVNDLIGVMFGIALDNHGPYSINFRSSANAKNIYVEAKSGFGKTFLLIGILLDAYADMYNLCMMDIKGTELIELTKACGGVVISLRQESNTYINNFRMSLEDIDDTKDARGHFGAQYALAKQRLSIICNFKATDESAGNGLLDEFLRNMYLGLGVSTGNPNTWHRTDDLTPDAVYRKFELYVSREVRERYGAVADQALTNMRTYMSKDGAYGYVHEKQYSYKEVLQTRALCFDFGLAAESEAAIDQTIFKLHLMDMKIINDAYVAYKYSKGEWTVKLLEESQICSDYLLAIYAKEVTLRRASNQVTFILGNSVEALRQNNIAAPILESINILVLGSMVRSSRDYFVQQYGLSDRDARQLELISTDPTYLHRFLIINTMKAKATTATVEAHIPDRVKQSKIFKGVDVVGDKIS